MHAYLIVDQNPERLKDSANKLAIKNNAQILSFSLEKIENVRELIKFSSLTLNKKTIAFIQSIDKASNEAMNAFLKILEEPQENLLFVLGSASALTVPTTVVSRCMVIYQSDDNYSSEYLEFAHEFFQMKEGNRFAQLTKIRTKDAALEFLKKLILGLHANMHSDSKEKLKLANLIGLAQKTMTLINMNGNVVIQLTNFGVQIQP